MPPPIKRLYEVRMEVTAYVEAVDEFAAQELGEEALREEARHLFDPILHLQEVTHRDWVIEGGWDRGCLVYGCDHDVRLGSLLDTLPTASAEK